MYDCYVLIVILGNIEYTCPASGECEINKRRRKACQACRFRKCLRSGMLKEGVRLDRVRGGRQKYRRNPESPYQVQVVTAPRPSLALEGNSDFSSFFSQNFSHVRSYGCIKLLFLCTDFQQHSNKTINVQSDRFVSDIKMLEALSGCEPDLLDVNTSLDNSKHRSLSILSDLYDRELVGIIGWAKQIPGFTELSLNDQMRLLQSTWAEILTLTLAFRSLPLMLPRRLKFAVDFTMDEKQSRECGAMELYHTVSWLASFLAR